MQDEYLNRLLSLAFGALICASLLAGGVGYISPVQAQPAPQKRVVVIATPRLPTEVPPTQAPLPTEVPPPPPTPEPIVIVRYVPVEVLPPTVPPPPMEPVGETVIQIEPVQEQPGVPHFGGRPSLKQGPPDRHGPNDAPEAVGP